MAVSIVLPLSGLIIQSDGSVRETTSSLLPKDSEGFKVVTEDSLWRVLTTDGKVASIAESDFSGGFVALFCETGITHLQGRGAVFHLSQESKQAASGLEETGKAEAKSVLIQLLANSDTKLQAAGLTFSMRWNEEKEEPFFVSN